jgi:hypothetical protein
MFAVPRMWEVLRTIGGHALRGLAALEPRGWNRHAQRNAALAAVLTREWRYEVEDLGWPAADLNAPTRVRASGG